MAVTIRPNASATIPTSAPEKGEASLVSKIMAGTEPAPTNTSRPVPMNSAANFCASECSSISAATSFRPDGGSRRAVPRVTELRRSEQYSTLPNAVRAK